MDDVERVARAIRAVQVERDFIFLLPDECEKVVNGTWGIRQDEARAAIAAMQGWRPIETAPRDGTRILLYGLDNVDVIGVGFWEDTSYETWSYVDENTKKRTHVTEGWFNTECDLYLPAHWMPLPEPPETQA